MKRMMTLATKNLRRSSTALFLSCLWLALPSVLAAKAADPEKEQAAAAEGINEAGAEPAEPEEYVYDYYDEIKGERYRLEKMPRVEHTYRWLDEDTIQVKYGSKLKVEKHDDDWLWIRYYESYDQATERARQIKEGVLPKREPPAEKYTPEVRAETAAAYRFDVEEVDLLRFEDFGHGLPERGQWRNGLDVADMNGDGELDIVFGPARKSLARPNVFLGDGEGRWSTWKNVRYPSQPYDYGDVEVADWNGDGLQDLAFGIHLRGLLVLVQEKSAEEDGPASFVPWSEGIKLWSPDSKEVLSAFSSRAIASVDWNGDGRLDLIALGEGPSRAGPNGTAGVVDASRGFVIFLNQGDGTWQPFRPLVAGETSRPNFGDGFAIGDLNGDGHLDLVSTSSQVGSQAILRVGEEGGQVRIKTLAEVRPDGVVSAVAIADVDADGFDDLILGYLNQEQDVWRTGIDVLYGGADFAFERRPLFAEESRRGISALATGEIDGDGDLDLVALTGRGEVFVYLGDGESFFRREIENPMPSEQGCQGYGLRLVDLDGDGRDEVVASFAGERVGFPGIPNLSQPGCTGEGSLQAWRAALAASQE